MAFADACNLALQRLPGGELPAGLSSAGLLTVKQAAQSSRDEGGDTEPSTSGLPEERIKASLQLL
jgi:hypothetical protein